VSWLFLLNLTNKGNFMKKLQIGVIGSCSDLNYSKKAEQFAIDLGQEIAKQKYTLVYGAEKDINSLPTIAAKAAIQKGATTLGITYEKGMNLFENSASSVVVATGLIRGGGRETTLMLSCDAVIAIAGGSGTLNEICVAYQANIPVIILKGFGGWSDKLADTFLDERKRYKFKFANTAVEAINIINQMNQFNLN
jgi:uncharacterized protein (TIGR00725 family)